MCDEEPERMCIFLKLCLLPIGQKHFQILNQILGNPRRKNKQLLFQFHKWFEKRFPKWFWKKKIKKKLCWKKQINKQKTPWKSCNSRSPQDYFFSCTFLIKTQAEIIFLYIFNEEYTAKKRNEPEKKRTWKQEYFRPNN